VETVAGIDNVMAIRPSHLEIGVNVTIVRSNMHDLMALTALAVAKGFSKINFQFTTPFGRAWEDVVPPLDEAANAVMRVIDRYAGEIQIHVINAQFCAFPGYERYGRRRPPEARPHDDLRRGPPLPGAGQPLRVARRATREAAGLRAVPVDDGVRGLPGVRPGETRHARRARRPVVAIA
jgi:MoaA/NifB/PqqE/SkfB family radical SAM enzyme